MKCPLEIHTGSIEGKERVYKNHILVQTPTCKASQTIEEKKKCRDGNSNRKNERKQKETMRIIMDN